MIILWSSVTRLLSSVIKSYDQLYEIYIYIILSSFKNKLFYINRTIKTHIIAKVIVIIT